MTGPAVTLFAAALFCATASAHVLYHRSADDPTRYHADVWPPVAEVDPEPEPPWPCDTSTSNRIDSTTITYFARLPAGEPLAADVPMPGEVHCARTITVAEVACAADERLCGLELYGAWRPEAGDVLDGFTVTLNAAGVLAVRPY